MKDKIISWLLREHSVPGYSLAIFWAVIALNAVNIFFF